MPVEFVSGDLLNTEGLRVFAHGCNCTGVMGKGIALEFKRRWPRMYEEYRRLCLNGEFTLGDVFPWGEDGQTVFNLATQPKPGPCSDLAAIDTSLRQMIGVAEEKGIDRIGLPRIGAGIGGLEWSEVRAVIEQVGATTPVTLVVFEEFVPAGS
jgi:O-acetyl-ADP-ribose deacetylase (regulator of RNase III)